MSVVKEPSQNKIRDILLNAYNIGENSIEIDVSELIEVIKEQLIPIINMFGED